MANETGKGGFGENPKNINKKGAPIGSSLNLTNVLKAELEKVPKGKKDAYKLMFIKTLLHKALIEKDLQAIKIIMNYVDGMPRQNIGLDGGADGLPIETTNEVIFKDFSEDPKKPKEEKQNEADPK